MKLIVLQGSEAVREIHLDRGRYIIGRGADCDVVLPEPEASRRHAELRRFGDRWLIVDLGSTNGTLVDGLRLQPDQGQPLLPGVSVSIGHTRFMLQEELESAAAEPPPGVTREEFAAQEAPSEAASPLWAVTAWVCRIVVLAGCAMLIVGALRDWVQIRVDLPLLGTVLDRTLGGRNSGQVWLFLGLAAAAALLVILDVVVRRSGPAAGLGQALLSLAVSAVIAVDLYGYYQVGTRKFFGISRFDIYSRYAQNYVQLAVKPAVYLLAAGLVALLLGGLLRLIVAVAEPRPQ